jgi:hypothetical protein
MIALATPLAIAHTATASTTWCNHGASCAASTAPNPSHDNSAATHSGHFGSSTANAKPGAANHELFGVVMVTLFFGEPEPPPS